MFKKNNAGLLACSLARLLACLLACRPALIPAIGQAFVTDGFVFPVAGFPLGVFGVFFQGGWDAEDLRLLSLAQDLPRAFLTTIRRGTWALLEAFLDRAPSPGGG